MGRSTFLVFSSFAEKKKKKFSNTKSWFSIGRCTAFYFPTALDLELARKMLSRTHTEKWFALHFQICPRVNFNYLTHARKIKKSFTWKQNLNAALKNPRKTAKEEKRTRKSGEERGKREGEKMEEKARRKHNFFCSFGFFAGFCFFPPSFPDKIFHLSFREWGSAVWHYCCCVWSSWVHVPSSL